MTENLFNQDTPPTNTFESLVGDGKKFKDAEALAKAKLESDEYIRTLTAQKDELRADYERLRGEYSSRESLEEIIDRMTNKQQQTTNSDHTPPANVVNNQPTFDPRQLESLVSSKIQEHVANQKYQENYQAVRNTLKERLGENYQEVLKQQIDTLGIDENTVNDMARKSPAAFFRLLGIDNQTSNNNFQTPPRSQQRPTTFAPQVQKRTWSYYQKMRKEQPEVYHDPKTAVQMHKDAQEMGEMFFDSE